MSTDRDRLTATVQAIWEDTAHNGGLFHFMEALWQAVENDAGLLRALYEPYRDEALWAQIAPYAKDEAHPASPRLQRLAERMKEAIG